MTKLLFDVTTIITLISDISHNAKLLVDLVGGLENWAGLSRDRHQHLEDELNDPVYPKLTDVIKDHPWFVTEATLSKTDSLIRRCGSASEIKRFEYLTTQLQVIPDDPSEEAMLLKGRIWDVSDGLNRKTIGTAHLHDYRLITGNRTAISKAINADKNPLDFDFVVHRSRCIFGVKYDPREKDFQEKHPDIIVSVKAE